MKYITILRCLPELLRHLLLAQFCIIHHISKQAASLPNKYIYKLFIQPLRGTELFRDVWELDIVPHRDDRNRNRFLIELKELNEAP